MFSTESYIPHLSRYILVMVELILMLFCSMLESFIGSNVSIYSSLNSRAEVLMHVLTLGQ